MQSTNYLKNAALDNYLSTSINELNIFVNTIDKTSLQAAVNLILSASKHNHRVHVTGIGKPSYVAGYMASLLSSIGIPSYKLSGTEAVHGASGQVTPDDVVIAISNSGETNELKQAIKTLKNNKAKIIAVTGDKKSWLAKEAEVCLLAGVENEGDNLNKPPRISILAETVILQCLSILLQEKQHLTLSEYVKWHPGGLIGKAIRENQVEI